MLYRVYDTYFPFYNLCHFVLRRFLLCASTRRCLIAAFLLRFSRQEYSTRLYVSTRSRDWLIFASIHSRSFFKRKTEKLIFMLFVMGHITAQENHHCSAYRLIYLKTGVINHYVIFPSLWKQNILTWFSCTLFIIIASSFFLSIPRKIFKTDCWKVWVAIRFCSSATAFFLSCCNLLLTELLHAFSTNILSLSFAQFSSRISCWCCL